MEKRVNDPYLVCMTGLPSFNKYVCRNTFLSVWSLYGLLTNHYIMKQESVSLPERKESVHMCEQFVITWKRDLRPL